jgi:DNA modification methylase
VAYNSLSPCSENSNKQFHSVAPCAGHHILIAGDSAQCEYQPRFDLVLTSPPYYHPTRKSSRLGIGFTGSLDRYVQRVADILCKVSTVARARRMCILKTDFWHNGELIPVGHAIADECVRRGMHLRAHWVWERVKYYSPYGPSLTNIFVFADTFSRPHFGGVISDKTWKSAPGSFAPEICGFLIDLLTRPGDTVIDPFAGIGTALEAAAHRGRFSVGIELSGVQVRKAYKRLKHIPGFTFKGTSCRPQSA